MNKILKIFPASILLFSVFLFVHAQGVSPRGSTQPQITFPIADLGNCASQVECKAYCNKAENIDACSSFAQAHGLIDQQQTTQNQNFAAAIKSGGPGGCTSADGCKTYCDDASHQDECIKFAQDHQLLPKQQLDQNKSIDQTLQTSGGPGGCKTSAECKTYCDSQDHQTECLAFAQSHNLISQDDATRLKKFQSLQASGQTPGGCATKDACETYCNDQTHQQECLDFGVKIGALTTAQADNIKQTGTQGPGGCTSTDACAAYCNDQSHHDECLKFATDHGVINEDQAKNIQQTQAKIQITLKNIPPQVLDCLKQTLDDTTISQIQSGQFTPTAETGKQVSDCFAKFKAQPGQNQPPITPSASTNVKDCLVTILGADAVAKVDTRNLDAAAKAALAKCRPISTTGQNQNNPSPNAQSGSSIKDCLVAKLGQEAMGKLSDPTQRNSDTLQAALKDCGYGQGLPPLPKPPVNSQSSNNYPPPPSPQNSQGILPPPPAPHPNDDSMPLNDGYSAQPSYNYASPQ